MNGRKISCLIIYSTTAMDTHNKVWWTWTALTLIQRKSHILFWWLTYSVLTACTKNVTPLTGNKIFLHIFFKPTKLMKRFGIGQAGVQWPHYCKRAKQKYPKDWWLKLQTCTGLSRDSKIWFSETLSQLTLNPAPRGSGGQNPRHRNVGGSCVYNIKYM